MKHKLKTKTKPKTILQIRTEQVANLKVSNCQFEYENIEVRKCLGKVMQMARTLKPHKEIEDYVINVLEKDYSELPENWKGTSW